MSVATLTLPRTHTFAQNETEQLRKRTSSFSSPSTAPPPNKLQRTRMGSCLRRSESMLIPSEPSTSSSSSTYTFTNTNTTNLTHQQQLALQRCKEQRIRRKAQLTAAGTSSTPITTPTQPQSTLRRTSSSASLLLTTPSPRRRPAPTTTPKPPTQIILPSLINPVTQYLSHRLTSPLSPAPQQRIPMHLPSRLARAPERSTKHKPKASENLYILAIKGRMSTSPTGQKILHMGPRLALGIENIMNANKELEMIVEKQCEREREREEEYGRMREAQREKEKEEFDFDYVMAEAEPLAPESSTTPALSVSPTSLATPVLTTKPWLQDDIDWEMINRPAAVECAA